ncbi:unnamed protein product [Rotaria sp. Silwood2]|nr:unnamed protein product [Rotaria sp. Silwood2]
MEKGIATWGYISGVDQLDVHGTNVHYAKPRDVQKDEATLEPNHTEFIFIDDGTPSKYGSELEFRSRFERAIAGESFSLENTTINRRHSSKDWSANDFVPVVLLVIEGGLEVIKTVHETIIQNNIPVVLLEGTGGCCDLFAKAYYLYNEYYSKTDISDRTTAESDFSPEQKEQIKNKLREKLKINNNEINQTISSENVETDYFELIYECIETRKILLNIINFNTHSLIEADMDLAILQVLLNATSGNDSSKTTIEQKREQLYLALEWNRTDIVKNFIMKDDRDWKLTDLNDLFEMALVRNQINFVQLFLDHDFSLVDLFENHEKLVTLYKNENFNLTQDLNNPLRSIYKEIIQPLTGDFFEVNAVFNPDEASDDIEWDDEMCSCCTITYLENLSIQHTNGAALIATLLYKIKARKDKDPSYNALADEFQNLAVQILEKFYLTDPGACTKAIIRQIPEFGNATWLHLAVMIEAKQFIAQEAVQHVLSDIWYGYIDHIEDNRLIIFSTIMLWYSGFLHYHQEMVERTEQFPSKSFNSSQKSSFIHHNTSRLQHQMNKTADKARLRLMQDMQDEEEGTVRVVGSRRWKNQSFRYGRHRHNQLATTEIILVVWLFALLCDEIRQIFEIELKSIYGKIIAYFSVFWNKLDLLAIFLFFLGFILRIWPTTQCFCAARIILAVDLSLWYIRTLDMFVAIKHLGPKLVMIGEMVMC